MSVPDFTPKISMKLGRIKSTKAREIKFAIYQSLMRALTRAVARTVAEMLIILPESRFRRPSYPPSYKTERLAATAIHVLRRSLADLKAKGFKVSVTRYELFLDFPASYTKWVNEMRGVRWSKPSTEEGFVELTQQFLLSVIRDELNAATVNIKGQQESLIKFVSKVGA